ncbi:Putative helicase [Pacmanvirus A23]|uniref:Putative helicase n=1 Tax=Pacmanvirus A23 TaxID=1932881 RepID=UPI000A095CE3|nr:Putative helicase [Pacmanvirus A23]SIP86101.1 Putative helicase [Pacmanvirus A23]
METKLNICEVNNKLGIQVQLDDDFDIVETPAGFRNIELYPHQATAVRALIDIEDKHVLTVNANGKYTDITNSEVKIETSAMVLSEPFGSGKTIDILGLILERPVPKPYPAHANSIILLHGEPKYVPYNKRVPIAKPIFRHEIIRKFTGPDALIKPNLIIAGSSVLVQWENAIKDFTYLRVFTIGNYYSLMKFYQLYKEKKLKAYDIILLKNGMVTGNFNTIGDYANGKNYHSMISIISKFTAGSCWSRVIYDDFDTISIPAGAQAINALFTIYVSATTKKTDTAVRNPTIKYTNIVEAMRERNAPLNNILKDKILFSNFNISNKSEFVELSTNIPIVKKFRYVYTNPDDNYIRLLGVMGEQDANNIMEMLNGDAIDTAAEALGIKTSSVADIFQRMLDKKYERYMNDQYVLETIENFRMKVLPQLEPCEVEGKERKHNLQELDSIRSSLVKKILPGADKCKFYSLNLEQMIDELYTEYQISKEQNGLAINRVIDNIKEGSCQVCCLPLEDMDTFIVRCCGLIVCDVCGIKGSQISLRYDYKTKCNTLCGSCANCKAPVYPQTDLIFVDRNFDMEALLKAKGDEKPEEPLPEPEIVEVKEPVVEIKNPKLKALKMIIETGTAEGAEEVEMKIPHLIEGRIERPMPPGIERKVLVFANYNETLNLIEDFLVEQNITYLRLSGTFKEKADTVKQFKKEGTVLLINSQQHCAGLNLQFSTDLCLFHQLQDENVLSQVCGRMQRVGRQYQGNIHWLLYKNETKFVQ